MTLAIDLSEDLEKNLRERALQAGVPLEEYARSLLVSSPDPIRPEIVSAPRSESEGTESLNDLLERIWREIPADVLESLPEDGASQHDHYIYGTPKRDIG